MLYICSYDALLDYYTNNADTLFPNLLFSSNEMCLKNGTKIQLIPFLLGIDQKEAITQNKEKRHFKTSISPNETDARVSNIFVSVIMGLMSGCTLGVWTGALIKSSFAVGSFSFLIIVSIGTLLAGVTVGKGLYRWYQINDIERKAKLVSKEITDKRVIRLVVKSKAISDQISNHKEKKGQEFEQLTQAKLYIDGKWQRAKTIQSNPDPAPSKS